MFNNASSHLLTSKINALEAPKLVVVLWAQGLAANAEHDTLFFYYFTSLPHACQHLHLIEDIATICSNNHSNVLKTKQAKSQTSTSMSVD